MRVENLGVENIVLIMLFLNFPYVFSCYLSKFTEILESFNIYYKIFTQTYSEPLLSGAKFGFFYEELEI